MKNELMGTHFRPVDEVKLKMKDVFKKLTIRWLETLLLTMENSNPTMCDRGGEYIEGYHSLMIILLK